MPVLSDPFQTATKKQDAPGILFFIHHPQLSFSRNKVEIPLTFFTKLRTTDKNPLNSPSSLLILFANDNRYQIE